MVYYVLTGRNDIDSKYNHIFSGIFKSQELRNAKKKRMKKVIRVCFV